MEELLSDCHVHVGYNPDIDKTSTKTIAEYSFITATSHDFESTNSENLARQNDKIKCLWWFDENTTIPADAFGGKYHATYTSKPINSDIHRKQLESLNGKTLLIHCGSYLNASPESTTSWKHAYNIAINYPEINVIFAHMGGTLNHIIKDVIATCSEIENIWLDTSGITNPIIIEHAVDNFNENRILFGSDIPWCSFQSQLHNVLDAEITSKQKRKITYHNMLELI